MCRFQTEDKQHKTCFLCGRGGTVFTVDNYAKDGGPGVV